VLTVLDMQPRQTGGGTGKSSDTIVYEMAAEILDQVVDKLDIDEARPDMFEVNQNNTLFSGTDLLSLGESSSRLPSVFNFCIFLLFCFFSDYISAYNFQKIVSFWGHCHILGLCPWFRSPDPLTYLIPFNPGFAPQVRR